MSTFSVFLRVLLLALLATAAAPLPAADSLPATSPLKFGSLTVITENDKYLAGSDRYYTNGFKLSALSAPLDNFTDVSVPAPVRWVATHLSALVPPGHDAKLGLSLGQNIYTPADIHTPTPNPADRPYSAGLYVGAAFQSYDLARGVLDTMDLRLGVVGPAAFGEQIQNGFHDLIHVQHALGWSHQIHNELGLVLTFARKWRRATAGARTGLGADVIPHAAISLGNVVTAAGTGIAVRAGWRLPADFGTDLIYPSGDSNSDRPGLSAFLFAAADGRAVARDITLDGNSFRSSPSVPKKTFVADLVMGFAVGGKSWQLSYSQAVRTKEFRSQASDDIFGSVSLTFYY